MKSQVTSDMHLRSNPSTELSELLFTVMKQTVDSQWQMAGEVYDGKFSCNQTRLQEL